MMAPDEVAPRAKNHYREEDYFSLNVRNGIIRNPIGTRMIAVPEELIMELHAGLEEEAGSAAGVILYQCGKWWGARFVKRHASEVRHFYKMEVGDLPLHFYLQVLKRVWALYGWGALDVGFDLREVGFVEATVQNAIYSDVVGAIGRPSDALVAGALAAVIGDASGRDLDCVEIACRSRGDQKCSFLVGMRSRVDVVEQWVKQGRTRAEIVTAIARGELTLSRKGFGMNTELRKILVGAEGRYLTEQELERFRAYAVGMPERIAAQKRLETAEPAIVAAAVERFSQKHGDYTKRVPTAREKTARDMALTLRYLGAAHVRDDADFFLRSYATWIAELLRAIVETPVLVDGQRALRASIDEHLDAVDARSFNRYLDIFIAELERG